MHRDRHAGCGVHEPGAARWRVGAPPAQRASRAAGLPRAAAPPDGRPGERRAQACRAFVTTEKTGGTDDEPRGEVTRRTHARVDARADAHSPVTSLARMLGLRRPNSSKT